MPGESKTSSRRILARERQAQALELRKDGATFDVIAKALGYATPDSAQKAINAALNRITDPIAEEVRKLALERLEKMYFAISWKIKVGDVRAIIAGVRIIDRQAKLLGLDSPIKIEGEVEHRLRQDMSSVPKADVERLLAEAERVLNGDNS